MSKNPNTVESQDDVTVNQGSRSSDVLVATIEKCEKLQKQLDVAVECLKLYAEKTQWSDCMSTGAVQFVLDRGAFTDDGYLLAENALEKIKELNNDNAR